MTALAALALVPAATRTAAHHPVPFAAGVVCLVGVVAGCLWWGVQARRRSLQARAGMVELVALSPSEFEHALARLCVRDGCRRVRVVGGAGDLGADVVAICPDGRRLVVQAKRYRPDRACGSPDVQRFGGTAYTVHYAQLAVVITTAGRFTVAAQSYARRAGIRLMAGPGLGAWQAGVGPPPWA